jgi:hypothetical protein
MNAARVCTCYSDSSVSSSSSIISKVLSYDNDNSAPSSIRHGYMEGGDEHFPKKEKKKTKKRKREKEAEISLVMA